MDNRICYYVVEHDCANSDDRHVSVHGFCDDVNINAFFTEIAKTICFDDITNDSVTDIVWHGEHYWYYGWEPGMVFRFGNDKPKFDNPVWVGCFPEWDH